MEADAEDVEDVVDVAVRCGTTHFPPQQKQQPASISPSGPLCVFGASLPRQAFKQCAQHSLIGGCDAAACASLSNQPDKLKPNNKSKF